MELSALPRTGTLHFVGIGGSGMKALAAVMLDRGRAVSGSDMHDGPALEALRRRGASIRAGAHRAESLPDDVSLVIASEAIPSDNPELVEARRRRVPIVRYATALGLAMKGARGIAIAGTHGKSTTTAMVATTLRLAGRDPSFVVGADVPQLGAAGFGGTGSEFVVEACEYRRSFLELPYSIGAIVNLDAEHLDYFGDRDGVVRAFSEFAARAPDEGCLVLGDAVARELPVVGRARRLTCGSEGRADVWAHALRLEGGLARFAIRGAFETEDIALRVPGKHFVDDALVAASVAFVVGVAPELIARGLSEYRGAKRRLEVLRDDAVTVLSDYAHHPTEIDAVREALRARYPGRRILAVFQPHQAARLRAFESEFARSLAPFDRVFVADVYRVRDTREDVDSVSADALARAIESRAGSAIAPGGSKATIDALGKEWRTGDVAVLLGAGDIDDQRDAVTTALPVPDRR